jgi:hypothetical protein
LRFFDPDQAVALAASKLKYDIDLKFVTGRDGRPIQEVVRDVALMYPYLIAPSGTVEKTPSTPRPAEYPLAKVFGKNADGQMAQKLYNENPESYRAMKEAARKLGLI